MWKPINTLFVESTLYILYLMARQSSKTFSCVLSRILSSYKNHSKIEMEYDWYYIKACLDTYFFQYVKVTFYVLLPWESERSFWKKCHPVCLSGEVFIKICSKKFISKDLLSQSQFLLFLGFRHPFLKDSGFILFCLFEWTPSQRKEAGIP